MALANYGFGKLWALAAVAVLACGSAAFADDAAAKPDDKAAKKAERKGKKGAVSDALFAFPKEIVLDDAQKAKLEELKKEWQPKLAAARKAVDAALTPEQKKARADAVKAGKEAGKKGKELQSSAWAAMALSSEQEAAYKAAEKAVRETQSQIDAKKRDLLTDAQRSMLPPPTTKKKEKKEKKDKSAA